MALNVEYKNEGGLYIVKVSDGVYYYGNGKSINAIGMSATQFLRFNPYFDYVAGNGVKIPDAIRKWIEDNQPVR